MSPRLWPPLLALAACIVQNPAYKDDAGGTDGATSGPDVTGHDLTGDSAPTSTGGGEGTTTSAASTTDASTTDASTTSTDTTDATTGPGCIPDPRDPTCVMLNISGHNYLRCEEELTWTDARAACDKRCATLVMFTESTQDTDQESLDLTAQLRMLLTDQDKLDEVDILDGDYPQQDSSRASWWIGGNRRDDDKWYWLDDTPMPGHAMGGWNPDDPDTNPDSDQQCAVLAVFGYDEHDGKWFDRTCDAVYRYLCELP